MNDGLRILDYRISFIIQNSNIHNFKNANNTLG